MVRKLPKEQQGDLFMLILEYVNDLNPQPEGLLDLVFEPIKQSLKRDLVQWNEIRGKRSLSGKLGGINSGKSRRKKQSEANEASASKTKQTKQTQANEAVSVNVNVNVNNKYPFESFWDLYEKKVEMHKCKLKWEQLNETEKEKIMSIVPKYVLSTPDVKYRANPLTWLNGKRWNDEIIETTKKEEYIPKEIKFTEIDPETGKLINK